MSGRTRVLIIDDDARLGEILRMRLEEEGFEVQYASEAHSGLHLAYDWHPHAILVDVIMPGLDGFETCHRLRDMTEAAIIIMSVKGRDEEVIRGLEAGADDYVVKPFEYLLLRARLMACLRRGADSRPMAPVRLAKTEALLMADSDRRLIFISDGRSVQLTPREFDLLQYLLRNRGRVLSPDAILANVWGPEYAGEETLVKQFIHRLRMKIEPDPGHPEYIVTIRGSGYAFEEDTRPRSSPRRS
jgi:DNA-binding response OmpR family regulator